MSGNFMIEIEQNFYDKNIQKQSEENLLKCFASKEDQDEYLIDTLFDPRSKKNFFLDEIKCEGAVKRRKEKLSKHCLENEDTLETTFKTILLSKIISLRIYLR